MHGMACNNFWEIFMKAIVCNNIITKPVILEDKLGKYYK